MAIAAGDTPSPEMVAAAGSDAGLPPAVAWPLLALAILGGLAFAALTARVVTLRIAAPLRPPDVLADRARELLRRVGLEETPQDSHWGMTANLYYLSYVDAGGPIDPRDDMAARGIVFWYRDSPTIFQRLAFWPVPVSSPRTVSFDDPAPQFGGENRAAFDREGRLVRLEAVPRLNVSSQPAVDMNWSPLFDAAGLDISAWSPAEPQWTPPFYADTHVAWQARDHSTRPLRVEASSYRGRPVSFHVIFPWTSQPREIFVLSRGEQVGILLVVVIVVTSFVAGVVVARRNIRLGRADVSGAARAAVFTGALEMLIWLLEEHHVPTVWELYLALSALGFALVSAAVLAVFYLSIEPSVRRTWPTLIVSWSRILAGSIRDPLVARDVLIGCAAAIVVFGIRLAGDLTAWTLSGALPRVITSERPLLGPGYALSFLLTTLLTGVFLTLIYLFLLIVLKLVVRREAIAIVLTSVLAGVLLPLSGASPLVVLPFTIAMSIVVFVLIARVGIVAAIASYFTGSVLMTYPFTVDTAAWYFRAGLTGIAVVAALAIAAFRIATAPHARTAPART
jgi:hypothetical protein